MRAKSPPNPRVSCYSFVMSVTAVLVPRRSWRPLLCFEFSEYDAVALSAVEEYGRRIGAEYYLTLCVREAIPGWVREHLPRRGLRRWWVRWEWNRMVREADASREMTGESE